MTVTNRSTGKSIREERSDGGEKVEVERKACLSALMSNKTAKTFLRRYA